MNSGNVEAAESARDQRKKLLEEQLQQQQSGRAEEDTDDDAAEGIEKEFNMDDCDDEVETDRFANLFVEPHQDARLAKEKDPYMTGDDVGRRG
ncbi:hypothetical protein Pmar_PMAR021845 [Perkinsus marinus ATCC 50983]|nr:hypothetical protein Pmar_PMAR021845 [Perkinsus marinus ATCC 50983]EER04338.1 hypothetical protein Pmar_PMAR021845 [Perkinsus marinus ATCC 50983]|eukprot:XP_002772522.1 hypothetical protein Pmar_PMAR021845 [Perkinsus marinus ATCC 50983]